MDLSFFMPPEKIEQLRGRFARQKYPVVVDGMGEDRNQVTIDAVNNSFFYLVNHGAKLFRTTYDMIDKIVQEPLDFTLQQYEQAFPVMLIEVDSRYFMTSKQGNAFFAFMFKKDRPHHFETYCLYSPNPAITMGEFVHRDQTGRDFEKGIVILSMGVNRWLYRQQTNPDGWMYPRQREKNIRANREYRDIQLIVPRQEIKLYQSHASEVVRPGIGAGVEKCPHQRRAHTRRLRDDEGNILKEIEVRACKIHEERGDWGQSSVEYRPDSAI